MMPEAAKKDWRTAKRGASPAGLCGMEEVEYVLEQLPGAEFRKKVNGVSFSTGAKVFAFLSGMGRRQRQIPGGMADRRARATEQQIPCGTDRQKGKG